ncbi:hypothetical protein HYU11_04370 [Candidatus Woesearchaeota archaeon]|nr:hypothetical protein [Candidatus Woesearchaeota archaeon]
MENRKNIENLERELQHFKNSINEWVMFLSQANKETNQKLISAERRLAKLELDNQLKSI